ncbi:hypothetical protein HGP28_18745 [Vibrio sp. SM6]|uniref:Transcriptional regulator VspR n=1 Tax=Vibrio agarilyticus TaxID=2726741 RepID=A0A7X8TU79_9VIBR|nr:hypothetical protein [Vibrio agarilyticus]NLS14899.1 hypothetical protein [Vibrio agarilyticus]
MRRTRKVDALMHKLLIEKRMDGFSVVELRNASLAYVETPCDLHELRKRLYRQLQRFESNNWLRAEGSRVDKRYFQTEQMNNFDFVPKIISVAHNEPETPTLAVLTRERNESRGELEIALGEVDEYQSLIQRFPELEPKLDVLLAQSRERSAQLLGKVNVLTKVLDTFACEQTIC